MRLYLPQILTFFLVLFNLTNVFGQDDCTVKLKEAQKFFDEGKIEKVPDLIDNCIESGFNKENRVAALKLLSLVYLYEDNMQKAEETLLKLLKIEPEYKIDRNLDPIEFIRLHSMYNTESVFSVGGILGANISTVRLIQTWSGGNYNDANPKYNREGLGLAIGAKICYHFNDDIDFIFEPKYSTQKYSINERINAFSGFTGIGSESYIELPVLASYYFYDYRDFRFFGDLGFSYGILMNSEIGEPLLSWDQSQNANYKGASMNTKDFRKNYLLSGVAGVGVKYNMKRDNIQLNIRYNMGFNNLIDEKVRNYNDLQDIPDLDELNNKFMYQENDFSISSFSFLISYNHEFYIHSKKK